MDFWGCGIKKGFVNYPIEKWVKVLNGQFTEGETLQYSLVKEKE